MKRTFSDILPLLIWTVIDAVCIAVNFNCFVFGSSYGMPWINLTVSVLFITFMLVLACKADTRFISILSCLYIVFGIIGIFVSKYGLLADWMIIPSIILFTPFAGIGHLLKSDVLPWLFFAGFGMVILMTAYSRKRRQQSS